MSYSAKISEIFQSIQGEGPYCGVRQVFVRFFGCHMHCVWCDTPGSIGDTTQHYKVMTVNQVFSQIKKFSRGCHSVSLTGGEPLLQVQFIQQLLPMLKKIKLKTYLETSGVLYKNLVQIVKDIDMISMDIKLPSSTGERAFWKEHAEFIKALVTSKKEFFVKLVVTENTQLPEVLKAAQLVKRYAPAGLLILQPDTFGIRRGSVEKCVKYQPICQKLVPQTRVMMQMHKFMKVR